MPFFPKCLGWCPRTRRNVSLKTMMQAVKLSAVSFRRRFVLCVLALRVLLPVLVLRQAAYRRGWRWRRPESALRKAFNANPRQEWVAIRLARTLAATGKSDEARQVLVRCLTENPTSRKAHYEVGMLYIKEGGDPELIYDHLRRSFTKGDQNYEAQFWYARQAFLMGKLEEANEIFRTLRNANVTPTLRNAVRAPILDEEGRSRVYIGEVVSLEDAYMFVRCPDFAENIFVHRSRVEDAVWRQFSRGARVAFTVGFSMRGPTAASINRLQ
jgi:cold shock CspA family protein